MEFIQINSAEDFRAKEIYKSYTTSFPEDERRSESQFNCLFTNPKVKVFSVLHNLEYIGYLIGWELSRFVFIEHFEIFSEFRSQKFGSEVIRDLFRDYSKIVLETEPENLNEDAKRRIAFYEKNGFKVIDKEYVQPPYECGKNPINLWLFANYYPDNMEIVREEIFDVVYCR